jgi:xanthine dehydrogenase small subunit
MRQHLLLYVNGQRHDVPAAQAFQPLSTLLREELGLTGTKIVCAEGDCGSCTVLLGRSNGTGNTIRYQPVCSCIQYLLQLDATHIVTVEGLAYDGQLNPVQEAMVAENGAQCGFCTPGFVTAMCSILDEQPAATDHDLCRGLVGNLCRCTGYGAILSAGRAVDREQLRKIHDLYDTAAIASVLKDAARETLTLESGYQHLYKPATVAEAAAYLGEHVDTTIIAGGTDLGVQTNKGLRQLKRTLSTAALDELREICLEDNTLVVGTNASLSKFETALLKHLPEYGAMLNWFGSPIIKNAGTLGGNIANGSPIGDTMPALYILNAEIELTSSTGTRRVNINDYYTGYKKSVRRTDELLTRVFIPLPVAGDLFKLYKISKRKDLDISTMTGAIWMQVKDKAIAQVRIAYGGVGPNILRLKQTEASLIGQPFDAATFRTAGKLARTEITPISDVRGAAAYRLQLAENLLLKFFHDLNSTDKGNTLTNGALTTSLPLSNGKGRV